jgi:hypothetical protein
VTPADGSTREVRHVSGEIETLRDELGRMVSELDRRRHELMNFRLQLRRHPAVVIVAAGVAALLAGGLLGIAIRRRRHRARPTARAREARRAIARLLEHPQRVAAEPNIAAKIATAIGVAAGGVVARRLAERLVSRPQR